MKQYFYHLELLLKKMINVIVIPMLSDNYCYYVYHDSNIQNGLFVDVSNEPDKIAAFMKAYELDSATHLLTTHKHADHSGGNMALAQ